MLTKKQLEDAARCMLIDCEDCSTHCVNTIEITRHAARTALAYREMLEQLDEFNGHASDCKLAALLKENKAKETRGTIRLIKTKSGYECENCGVSFKCEPQKDKHNFIKYCPNCGIKFDEREESI